MKRIAGLLIAVSLVAPASAGNDNVHSAKMLNALTTTVTAIKPGPGLLYMLQCYNPNASGTQAYVQLFSLPAASVTLGTTTPILSIPIAGVSTGGFVDTSGVSFAAGMSAAATTTATGSTALSTAVDCDALFN